MANSKIMFIRHAEKPGVYNNQTYGGVNALGQADDKSLVTMGWERAGGVAQIFCKSLATVYPALAQPTLIYAADPNDSSSGKEPSQRPYQTASALAAKLGLTIDTQYKKDKYLDVVKGALQNANAQDEVILISWQHQDILTSAEKGVTVGMAQHLCQLTQQDPATLGLPQNPWPGTRYDMVLVFDLTGGQISQFTQVPQMLLVGDSATLFT
jgi:hypothetical protein